MALDTYSEMAPARETDKRKEKLEKLDWKQSLDLKKIKIFCAHSKRKTSCGISDEGKSPNKISFHSQITTQKTLFSFSFSNSSLELSDAAAWGKEKTQKL